MSMFLAALSGQTLVLAVVFDARWALMCVALAVGACLAKDSEK